MGFLFGTNFKTLNDRNATPYAICVGLSEWCGQFLNGTSAQEVGLKCVEVNEGRLILSAVNRWLRICLFHLRIDCA